MKNKLITSLLCASLMISLAGCAKQTDNTTQPAAKATDAVVNMVSNTYLEGYDTFEVISPDVIDGVWVDDISNTKLGDNSSPALSWQPVEGAEEYVIYMVDRNSKGFLHWKSGGVKETELPRGWAPKDLEYNGPHVGHGYTHMYDIYVPIVGDFDRKFTYEEAKEVNVGGSIFRRESLSGCIAAATSGQR